ncbi:MAG: hypothetical protein WCJ69_12585 [Betaproteobacteria bacterium]
MTGCRIRRRSRTRLATLVLLGALSGCQSGPAWRPVDQPRAVVSGQAFEADAPVGWMRREGTNEGLFLTRDGIPMQYVRIHRDRHEDAFRNIRKAATADLLPTELAELIIASRRAVPVLSGLVVVSNEPASFAGLEGVRLRMRYRTLRGASLDQLVYAAVERDTVLFLEYQALSRTYFDRDLPAFEQTVSSFRDLGARPVRR